MNIGILIILIIILVVLIILLIVLIISTSTSITSKNERREEDIARHRDDQSLTPITAADPGEETGAETKTEQEDPAQGRGLSRGRFLGRTTRTLCIVTNINLITTIVVIIPGSSSTIRLRRLQGG